MELSKKIINLLSSQGCGVLAADQIREEDSLFLIGFDSLRFMELVVLVEEEFRITLPDEILEITQDMRVMDIITVVKECVKE